MPYWSFYIFLIFIQFTIYACHVSILTWKDLIPPKSYNYKFANDSKDFWICATNIGLFPEYHGLRSKLPIVPCYRPLNNSYEELNSLTFLHTNLNERHHHPYSYILSEKNWISSKCFLLHKQTHSQSITASFQFYLFNWIQSFLSISVALPPFRPSVSSTPFMATTSYFVSLILASIQMWAQSYFYRVTLVPKMCEWLPCALELKFKLLNLGHSFLYHLVPVVYSSLTSWVFLPAFPAAVPLNHSQFLE